MGGCGQLDGVGAPVGLIAADSIGMLLLLATVSLGADPADPILTEAEPLPDVSPEMVKAVQPRAADRPGIARGQLDFTAYTLEWGEVRLGVADIGVGIFPRTQLGTIPLLDVVGVPNVSAKLNAVRVGGFDMAATGGWGALDDGSLRASYLGTGVVMSMQLAKPWSIHGGVSWLQLTAEGTPQLDAVALMLGQSTGVPIHNDIVGIAEGALALDSEVQTVTVRAATDVRLNRRDSIILQGEATIWSSLDLPAFAEGIVADEEGFIPVTDAYSASLAWQFSFRHLELRAGVGISSIPGAWLLNSVDLAYRFGGPTRSDEHKRLTTWKKNRRAVAKAEKTGEWPGKRGGGTR